VPGSVPPRRGACRARVLRRRVGNRACDPQEALGTPSGEDPHVPQGDGASAGGPVHRARGRKARPTAGHSAVRRHGRRCRSRAPAIRSATAADGSGSSPSRMPDGATRSIDTQRSSRFAQRSGDPAQVATRQTLRTRACPVPRPVLPARARVHRRNQREPRREHAERPTRTTEIDPSSSGLAQRLEHIPPNSGSSSQTSTPWSARVTSPGESLGPPPTMPAYEVVWCGILTAAADQRSRGNL